MSLRGERATGYSYYTLLGASMDAAAGSFHKSELSPWRDYGKMLWKNQGGGGAYSLNLYLTGVAGFNVYPRIS